MAHECLGGVEVVALCAGHAAREEGVPAVGPLVAAALVTPDTVSCKQSFIISRTGEMKTVSHVCVTVKTRSLLTSPIDTTIRRHRREESTDTDMLIVVTGADVEFCNDSKVWSVEAAAGYLWSE